MASGKTLARLGDSWIRFPNARGVMGPVVAGRLEVFEVLYFNSVALVDCLSMAKD